MKTLSRTIATSLLGLLFSTVAISASAQEEAAPAATKGEFSAGADLVSSYVWRGFGQGSTSPAIQPTVKFAYGSLSIGAWGSTNFEGSSKEADFFVGYAISDKFSVTLTDYNWAFSKSYFDYEMDLDSGIVSDHVYEISLAYAGDKLSAAVNTMFYGNDIVANDNGEAVQGYTTYIELGYALTDNTSLAVGGLLTSNPGTAYAVAQESGFNICNISLKSTKEIKVTDSFSIPVFGSVILNPMTEDVNFVIGASF